MPVQRIENLSAGTHLFIDANIFVYAFLGHSDQCRDLLGLCATEQVRGVTTLDVVNEVTHRMMLAEALARPITPSAAFLEIWPAPDSCNPKAGRWP